MILRCNPASNAFRVGVADPTLMASMGYQPCLQIRQNGNQSAGCGFGLASTDLDHSLLESNIFPCESVHLRIPNASERADREIGPQRIVRRF